MEHAPIQEPVSLPVGRPAGCPFDPPADLARLREQRPIARMSYAHGHVGWLVTSHELARAVLADTRFSSRYELLHLPWEIDGVTEMPPAPVGDMTGMDQPEHTRYRKLLAGKFTVRRMRQLTERVEQVTAEHLDAMQRQGGPLDLVRAFAYPVPAIMMCELLGVPYADRDRFQGYVAAAGQHDGTPEDQYAAYTALQQYLHELVLAKRAQPTDDLLSDLTSSDLTDEELAGVGAFLLAAGLDTTANMIGLGTFALLRHPDQLAALRADPGIAEQAVEELLRYLSIATPGMRAALADVELGGELIRAGDTVTVAIDAANRDAAKFPHPDALDLRRQATGHLAFGHGIHQCLGQQLARVELRVALPALVTRFPTLRLAVPAEDVPMREKANIHGVRELPVTWDS